MGEISLVFCRGGFAEPLSFSDSGAYGNFFHNRSAFSGKSQVKGCTSSLKSIYAEKISSPGPGNSKKRGLRRLFFSIEKFRPGNPGFLMDFRGKWALREPKVFIDPDRQPSFPNSLKLGAILKLFYQNFFIYYSAFSMGSSYFSAILWIVCS